MDELRKALEQIGIPVVAIPFVIIAVGILLYFIKRGLDQRDNHRVEQQKTIRQYAAEQEKALLEAYRILYEQVSLTRLTDAEFVRTVTEADDLLMRPFTAYRAYLHPDVIARVYSIHNILAQFKGSPDSPLQLSDSAKLNLLLYKDHFLKDIEGVRAVVRERALV